MSEADPYVVLMSKAIRSELERHGRDLVAIPTEVLEQYAKIVGAFYGDLMDELRRRRDAA